MNSRKHSNSDDRKLHGFWIVLIYCIVVVAVILLFGPKAIAQANVLVDVTVPIVNQDGSPATDSLRIFYSWEPATDSVVQRFEFVQNGSSQWITTILMNDTTGTQTEFAVILVETAVSPSWTELAAIDGVEWRQLLYIHWLYRNSHSIGW